VKVHSAAAHAKEEQRSLVIEDIVLARSGWGYIIVHLTENNGRWYTGHDYLDASGGTCSRATVDDRWPSYPSREEAPLARVERARDYLTKRMNKYMCWRADRARKEWRDMLAQINAAYPPAGTQLQLI
jgi:hypothetical protein